MIINLDKQKYGSKSRKIILSAYFPHLQFKRILERKPWKFLIRKEPKDQKVHLGFLYP